MKSGKSTQINKPNTLVIKMKNFTEFLNLKESVSKTQISFDDFKSCISDEISALAVDKFGGKNVDLPFNIMDNGNDFTYEDDGHYTETVYYSYVPLNFKTLSEEEFFESCRKRVEFIAKRFGLVNPLLQSNFIKNNAGSTNLSTVLHTLSDRDAKNWYKDHALPNRNVNGYFGVLKAGSAKSNKKIKLTYSFFIPFSEDSKFHAKPLNVNFGHRKMYETFEFEYES